MIDTLASFIAANPRLAYGAVLLLALSESLPVIGAFIPGSAIIIALSALVAGGELQLWPLLFGAFTGAIAGDGFAFWLGHRYQQNILTHWPLSDRPELIARGEAFFSRHGDKSVFIARFTPGVRAIVPLFAGILKMPVRRFYAANILSAMIWAPSHVLPGVLAGEWVSYLGTKAEIFMLAAAVVATAAWLILRRLMRPAR